MFQPLDVFTEVRGNSGVGCNPRHAERGGIHPATFLKKPPPAGQSPANLFLRVLFLQEPYKTLWVSMFAYQVSEM
jgi:hypothetical protein